jgi:hypothetical protein
MMFFRGFAIIEFSNFYSPDIDDSLFMPIIVVGNVMMDIRN